MPPAWLRNKKRARQTVPWVFKGFCLEVAILLCEAGHGFGFGVEDIKDGQQLGDLQDFLELAAEVAEAQRGALRLHAVMRGNQRAQTGAVDEGDVVHTEDNFLFPLADQAFTFS